MIAQNLQHLKQLTAGTRVWFTVADGIRTGRVMGDSLFVTGHYEVASKRNGFVEYLNVSGKNIYMSRAEAAEAVQ